MDWRKYRWPFLIGLVLTIALSVLGIGGWNQSNPEVPNVLLRVYAQTIDPIELRSQGQTLVLEGRCEEAISILNQALDLYRAENADPETSDLKRDTNLISEVNIFIHLSRCYFQLEDYDGLLSSLSDGIETRNQLTARSHLSPAAQAGLGPLADWLDSWRNQLASDAERIDALDQSRKFFNQLTQILMELGDTDGALAASEKGRARAIADLLFAGLSNTPSGRATIAQTPTLQEIRRIAQAQQATLVEYAIMATEINPEDTLYIWVVHPSGEIQFTSRLLAANNQSLKETIRRSRSALGARLRGGFEVVEPQQKFSRNSYDDSINYLFNRLKTGCPRMKTIALSLSLRTIFFWSLFPLCLMTMTNP